MKIKSIKISILITFFTLGMAFPIGSAKSFIASVIAILICYLGGMWYPFIAQYDFALGRYIVHKPKWSDKLVLIKPLTIAHLIAYLLLSCGAGLMIGELIQTQTANFIGLCLVASGYGVISGIDWAVKISGWNKDSKEQEKLL